MKKLIILFIGMLFCGGCYTRMPTVGVKTLQPVKSQEKVCVTKRNPANPATLVTRCSLVTRR